MSTTPDCRCGHPSRHHAGGSRPWPCGSKDCRCRDFVAPSVRPEPTEPHRTTAPVADLWARDGLQETAAKRSLRLVWPELAKRLDALVGGQEPSC